MDRNSSPVSNSESLAPSSPPSSPGGEESPAPLVEAPRKSKKLSRKKRKANAEESGGGGGGNSNDHHDHPRKHKKAKQRKKQNQEKSSSAPASSSGGGTGGGSGGGGSSEPAHDGRKKNRKHPKQRATPERSGGLSAAQQAVNEQMRRALEEDQYSATGSIVETDSDSDDHQYIYRGQTIRLDRTTLLTAARKHLWLERGAIGPATGSQNDDDCVDVRRAGRKKKKKGKRNKDDDHHSHRSTSAASDQKSSGGTDTMGNDGMGVNAADGNDMDRDEGSIFGQTTGSSNSTWVECDKCKKWRRLRGVVDEKKLPSKWYCSMNKNDPERARCSAPEEEYEAQHTPESAADARTRKHLRVWVRRLQCNEAYEARQPTLTRGKKRATASSSKEPYEWVRCCNPSCGKWRAVLRSMDAKTNVIERSVDGEWYCVMNTWDEKTASCAATQENLPAIGCPPWVMQDEN